jgi:hypothetical protein
MKQNILIERILKVLSHKAVLLLIVGFIFLLIYLDGYRQGSEYQKKILANPQIVSGIVKSLQFKYKVGYIVIYKFILNGNEFLGESSNREYEGLTKIINKSFPVIVNKHDPQYSRILITPTDFEDYRMEYPDSLNWIRNE